MFPATSSPAWPSQLAPAFAPSPTPFLVRSNLPTPSSSLASVSLPPAGAASSPVAPPSLPAGGCASPQPRRPRPPPPVPLSRTSRLSSVSAPPKIAASSAAESAMSSPSYPQELRMVMSPVAGSADSGTIGGWGGGGSAMCSTEDFAPPVAPPISQAALDFYNETWPPLAAFVETALDPDKQSVQPLSLFSHEDLYRRVYKLCLRNGLKQKLREDLFALAAGIVERQALRLMEQPSPLQWFFVFGSLILNAVRASRTIRDVFAYFENSSARVPLTKVIDLRATVLEIVKEKLVDPFQVQIFSVLRSYATREIRTPPNEMAEFLNALCAVSPDSVVLNPSLFYELAPNPSWSGNMQALYSRYLRLEADMSLLQTQTNNGDVQNGTHGGVNAAGVGRKRGNAEAFHDDFGADQLGGVAAEEESGLIFPPGFFAVDEHERKRVHFV
ncbi:hypothetical protein DFJ73DRAFT_848092 [Zopfochytrium polystomum]|nr:hypothetical protein DFJ73DRAFT_848092 [Zopfochytrium polystomum]